jgi:uncharacterized membrane protein YphA (DoxX/SURF4 family)
LSRKNVINVVKSRKSSKRRERTVFMHAFIRPWWRRLADGPRERQAMAFLRIAAGLFFLGVGFEKFRNPDFPALMADAVKAWASAHPQAVYQAFLETVVLPNHVFFARFVTWAELLVGASYVTGGLMRYSAPLAVLLNVNFLLATQHTGADALGINLAFLGGHLTLLWGRAGRCYGLDALFLRLFDKKFGRKSVRSGPGGKSSSRRPTAADGRSASRRRSARSRSDERAKAIGSAHVAGKAPARVRALVKNAVRDAEKNVAAFPPPGKASTDDESRTQSRQAQSQASGDTAPSPISPRIRDLRDS